MDLELQSQIAFWMMTMSLLFLSVFAYPVYKNIKAGEFNECSAAAIFTMFTFLLGVFFTP